MLIQCLKRAGFGFILGMAVGNLIAALTGHPGIVSPTLLERTGSLSVALLQQTLLSGVIGAAGMGGTVLYELDRPPLLAIDTLHFACVMAVFIPVSLYLGWAEAGTNLLLMIAIMALAHTVIFLIMCARYRAEVRRLNRMQMQFLLRAGRRGVV